MKETKRKECVHNHEFVSKISHHQDKNVKGIQDYPSWVTHLLFLGLQIKYIVGGGSLRGQKKQLTLELELGKISSPLAIITYFLPTIPTVGAIFKDAPMREQYDLETILNGMHD